MPGSTEISCLNLKAVKLSDVGGLYFFIQKNRIWLGRFFPVTVANNKSINDSKSYILKKIQRRKEKKEYVFTLKFNNDENIKGLIIIKKLRWDLGRAELAYCIDSELANNGWTTKAVSKILYFAIEVLGLSVIEILSHKTNKASIRVAEKSGFRWIRTMKDSFRASEDEYLDVELYEKTDEGKILPLYRATTG